MGNSTIMNAKNILLNVQTGTVPDVSGGMKDYFQPMVFERVLKTATGFQVVETDAEINFRGVIQPLSKRLLQLKPEGQRAWTWLQLNAEPVLSLQVDDVVNYLGVQTRVMALADYTIYGYVSYELVQDWTGSGPTPGPDTQDIDGGNAATVVFDGSINGGNASAD